MDKGRAAKIIEEIFEGDQYGIGPTLTDEQVEAIQFALQNLKEPERSGGIAAVTSQGVWTAEWKEYDGEDKGFHYCSACKQQAFNFEEGREIVEVLSDFCPSCGRGMTLRSREEMKKRGIEIEEQNHRQARNA